LAAWARFESLTELRISADYRLDRRHDRRYTRSTDRQPLNPIKPMTLTKRDLVTRISEETGLTQQQVLDVVQKTLDYIGESLAKGDKVELRNFGVFEVKTRKARVGRNPNAPETDVPIPARSVVKFKAGKEMAAAVIKLPPQPAA
jgi:nucleoid DNA-binding protein